MKAELASTLMRTNSDGAGVTGGPKATAVNRLASTAPASFAQSTPLISSGSSHQQQQQQQQQSGEAASLSNSSRPFIGLKGPAQRPAAAAALAIPGQSKTISSGGKGTSFDDDSKASAAALQDAPVLPHSTRPMVRVGGGAGSGVSAAPQRIQKPVGARSTVPSAVADDEEINTQLQMLTVMATTWTQREGALLSLNDLLLKRPPSPLQVERTVDAVSERLADPHPRVACACMLVLNSLLQVAPIPLSPRIDSLLPRVFTRASEAKRTAAGASGCPQEAAFSWLASLRDIVPADVLLPQLVRCIDAPQLPLRGRLLALDMLASSAMNHR